MSNVSSKYLILNLNKSRIHKIFVLEEGTQTKRKQSFVINTAIMKRFVDFISFEYLKLFRSLNFLLPTIDEISSSSETLHQIR